MEEKNNPAAYTEFMIRGQKLLIMAVDGLISTTDEEWAREFYTAAMKALEVVKVNKLRLLNSEDPNR